MSARRKKKSARRIVAVPPFLQLGAVRLSAGLQPGKVWIQHFDGEGGDFDAAKLGRLVEAFFWNEL